MGEFMMNMWDLLRKQIKGNHLSDDTLNTDISQSHKQGSDPLVITPIYHWFASQIYYSYCCIDPEQLALSDESDNMSGAKFSIFSISGCLLICQQKIEYKEKCTSEEKDYIDKKLFANKGINSQVISIKSQSLEFREISLVSSVRFSNQ